MTDPNIAQPPWHGVIKRTIGGSLARSCRPRCRAAPAAACCCYYYYLLLLGLSAAAANDRCAVVDSAVRRVSGDFRLLLCVCTRLVRSRTSMRSHQGTESSNKRTIGGSLACSWPPPLPRRRRCCVLLLLLLGLPILLLPIIVVLFLLLLRASFALCVCSRMYGASSRELEERHASCDILLSLCYSCGCCGCCECFYVLLPPPPPLLLLLSVVMDF